MRRMDLYDLIRAKTDLSLQLLGSRSVPFVPYLPSDGIYTELHTAKCGRHSPKHFTPLFAQGAKGMTHNWKKCKLGERKKENEQESEGNEG